MKVNKKINAFTLSEMIVVLILTSIVAGLAFSVLILVQKHMHTIKNNFTQGTELNKLEQSLWIDFNRHAKIEFNEKTDKLMFSTEMGSIEYTFGDEFIVKDKDTFNIEINKKTLFFDGNGTNNGIIDAMKLETSKTFQNKHLFVFKQNDATQFIN